jgi:hypothetical protein
MTNSLSPTAEREALISEFQAWEESFWREVGRYPMQHEVWIAAHKAGRAALLEPVGEGWVMAAKERDDAARYRFLKDRLLGVDFDYCESGKTVLMFDWPRSSVSADCDWTVDEAMQYEPIVGAKP